MSLLHSHQCKRRRPPVDAEQGGGMGNRAIVEAAFRANEKEIIRSFRTEPGHYSEGYIVVLTVAAYW